MRNLSRQQLAARARRCQILTVAALAVSTGLAIAALPDPVSQTMTVAEECDLREAMTETAEQYAYCDNYYHRRDNLPEPVACDTDADCEEKNPEIAAFVFDYETNQ